MNVIRRLNRLAAGTAAVAAIAAVAGAGLAQADGMPGKRVVYEKPWDWGGLYFGVQSGWQWSSDINVQNPFFPPGYTVDHDSPIVGGQIGIQHQFGQIVVGIEGSAIFTYQNNASSDTCPNPAFTCAARLDDILTVGPRVGYAAGKWMPYVTGGYANGAFHHIARQNGVQIQIEEARARLSGWYIGAGVDMALAHGWTVGIEYRHYDFGDKTVVGFAPGGIATEPVQFVDPTVDTLSLRVSWKLGRPDRVSPLK
jgi:opacity protein-like surface antigen